MPSDKPIHLIKADLSAPSEAERVYNVVTKELGVSVSPLCPDATPDDHLQRYQIKLLP